ncbi:MAG: DUF389 domain-containing protein [Clostridia bacterium]|nr:DUF389 domain-containing protein [Clostridia bacterium]
MRYLKTAFCGAAFGVLCNNLLMLMLSYVMQFGYYASCLATFTEYVGGELNATALQTAAAMIAGAGIALAFSLRHRVRPVVGVAVSAASVAPAVFLLCLGTVLI